MKKIDVIRSGSLSLIIGPSGTMKRIIKNREYFLSRGYDINIFTHDSIQTGKSNVVSLTQEQAIAKRQYHKQLLTNLSLRCRMWAKKNVFLANYYIKLADKRSLKLINYYLSLGRNADIVVVHSQQESYLFTRLCKNKSKLVTFLHNDGTHTMSLSYFPCVKGKWGEHYMIKMFDSAIEQTDKLCFISKIARDSFVQRHPDYPKEKIGLVVNGIEDLTDEEKQEIVKIRSRYSDFKFRLCCIGTINRRKGQWIVLEALAEMDIEKRKDIHVSFIGTGPQEEELQGFVKNHKLDRNVTFEGSVDNSNVYKYLAEHNIYILMSDNEGLPISIIEAMRAGLPVISTRVAGIPETVDKNGLLLDVDKNQLLEVFNNIDTYDWNELGEQSRQKFETDFLFSRMAENYCDVMDSLFE